MIKEENIPVKIRLPIIDNQEIVLLCYQSGDWITDRLSDLSIRWPEISGSILKSFEEEVIVYDSGQKVADSDFRAFVEFSRDTDDLPWDVFIEFRFDENPSWDFRVRNWKLIQYQAVS